MIQSDDNNPRSPMDWSGFFTLIAQIVIGAVVAFVVGFVVSAAVGGTIKAIKDGRK